MSGEADRARIRKRDDTERTEAAEGAVQREAAEMPIAASTINDTADAVDSTAARGVPITTAAASSTPSRSSTAAADSAGRRVETAGGVQPLAEQMKRRPRRSPQLHSPFDLLATVELQLVMQFLDASSKLKAARCSRRLMQTASQPFAWKDAPPLLVEARSAADVERIVPSLVRFAPIDLRCMRMESFDCIATIPHLHGLELQESSIGAAASLIQLLQHPCMAQLQSLRLDAHLSFAFLTTVTARLIARLPQLRALNVQPWPGDQESTLPLLQPLADAPALTDLALSLPDGTVAIPALLDAIARIAGLSRLRLRDLREWSAGTFRSFFCSPIARRLQHLELEGLYAHTLLPIMQAPSAAEYEAAVSSMQQLQALTLDRVFGLSVLLPHLRHAAALRQLSIRCHSQTRSDDDTYSVLPSGSALAALLAAAPQLEVRLLLPPTLAQWMAQGRKNFTLDASTSEQSCEEQWQQLHQMGEEMERVTVVHEQSA